MSLLRVTTIEVVEQILWCTFILSSSVKSLENDVVTYTALNNFHSFFVVHASRVIGTVEQRISGMLVGTLVALSVFLGSILGFIPLAALYGMFLYMGVMGLRDLQFFQRFLALLKRRKHWEDWECVRGLPSQHILVFATIQALVIAILVALNIVSEFTTASYAGIIFPLIILIYGVLREAALPKWTWLALYLHQVRLLGCGNDRNCSRKIFQVVKCTWLYTFKVRIRVDVCCYMLLYVSTLSETVRNCDLEKSNFASVMKNTYRSKLFH